MPAKTNAVPTAFARRKADDEQERGYCKAPPADPVSPTAKAMKEPKHEVDHSARSENCVDSTFQFLPFQRPDLGLLGSSGMAVHGWQPMLAYPSSY